MADPNTETLPPNARLCTLCAHQVATGALLKCAMERSPVDGAPLQVYSRRMFPSQPCGTEGKQWEPAATLDPETVAALADPAASIWLRASLAASLDRDPVDAANDAEALAALLDARARRIAAVS
jgi:hypothetical protein